MSTQIFRVLLIQSKETEYNSAHSLETQMMIRKPIAHVFKAFINPSITSNYCFTKGSTKLEAGKSVVGEWEMYGVSNKVSVNEIFNNKLIRVEWDEPPTTVEFIFKALSDSNTYVVI